jgi:hypothetical protein
MPSAALLDQLQCELARLNDIPVNIAASDYHLGHRSVCGALLGRNMAADEDEQLLLLEGADAIELSLYVDDAVLTRLAERDPLHWLDAANLADYCTAMEGVSHFQYVAWCLQSGRQVSLLELELQAEVDKYAVATRLLRRQGRCELEGGLWRRLFDDVSFLNVDGTDVARRYREANRHAAVFCRRQATHLGRGARFRPEAWLRALRELYRSAHHQKLRRALQ